MNASDLVGALLKAAVAVKSNFEDIKKLKGIQDIPAYVDSSDFKTLFQSLSGVLSQITTTELSNAIKAVNDKKSALLGNRKVADLPPLELLQYSDLLDLEGVLVRKELAHIGPTTAFVDWLVNDAGPTLIGIAKVVLPILL